MKNILLESEDFTANAVLNDSVAALDFAGRLPLYLCCKTNGGEIYARAANGIFEPLQMQLYLRCGDIVLKDGRFIIYTEDIEDSSGGLYITIGHTDEFEKLKNTTKNFKLKISAVKQGGL